MDFSGDPQQAANYYGGFGSLQTVAFFLSGFQGLIRIEATLESQPTTDDQWFRVYEFDSQDSPTTNNFSTNITGNFVWVRARVTGFDAGTITKLMMSY
jgi:hypothetical protein